MKDNFNRRRDSLGRRDFKKDRRIRKKSWGNFEWSNEKAKKIIKDVDQKIKEDSNKVISDIQNDLEQLKKKTKEEADKAVNVLLKEEEARINEILNISDNKIDGVVKLLEERIVK